MANISSITYQPKDQPYEERLDFFIRVPIDEAELIAGHGIDGDEKAGSHPKRQLNLISAEWLEKMKARGFKTNPGEFGEQMIVEGMAIEKLESGTQLQLGDNAVIEITTPRTGCERMQLVQGEVDAETKKALGMMAAVVTGGTIHVGEPVKLLEQVEKV